MLWQWLSFTSRFRPARRARRRLRPDLAASLESLEDRLLLAASIPGLPYNDSNLAPAGLQSVTALPNLPVFNVMNYGAKGNGTTDDTVAIRAAISAASSAGGGIIFFPAGTYAVDPQPGDVNANPLFPVIFPITTSNLVFMGEGANKSILSGYMPGLQNPVTHWNLVTGVDGDAISRFGMFSIITSAATGPISNIQFRSLNIDGNAGYTGNSTTGGVASTGDGWDLSHKAIDINGSQAVNNILVFNTTIDNWRGEEVYSGGPNIGSINLINDNIYGTNADGVSTSANLLIANTTIGGTSAGDDVYNGLEDFDLGAPQKTVIQNSVIIDSSNAADPHGNGIAYLGLPTSSLTVTNTQFSNNNYAILFSEVAHNVTIENDAFSNNAQSMIDSILGLYPQYPTGFSDFLIEGNTFANSGSIYVSQDYGGNYSFQNLVIRDNTITNGVILSGGYNGPAWTGFIVDGNTLGSGASDISNTSSYVGTNYALWTNTTRLLGSSNGAKFDDFGTETTTPVTPFSDLTFLNANVNSGTQFVSIPSGNLYPVGFTTTFIEGSNTNWVLPANSSWNTFTSNVPVGPNGVTIRMDSKGLWDLVSSNASQLAFVQTPTTGTAGQALGPAVQVAVEDGNGNVIAGDNSTVTLLLNGGTFGDGSTAITAQAVNGIATFSSLILDQTGNYTLTASDGTLSGAASGGITINPAAASQLVFVQNPLTATVGQALSPAVQVAVEDQFGNVVTGDNSSITLAPSSGGITGATVQAVNGVATFSNLAFNQAGNFTLGASDGSLTGATSTGITVYPAASTNLEFVQSPTTGTAGQALSPTVQIAIVNPIGGVNGNDNSTVTLTLSGGTFAGGGTTITAQAVNGVATFNNLIFSQAGNYTLTASDGSLGGAVSATITVNSATSSTGTMLAFVQTPSTGIAGQALSPAVEVAVEDQNGNTVTSDSSTVTLTLSSGTFAGGGTTVSAQVVNGIATFNNLVLSQAGGYTLTASDGSLTGAVSGTITVSQGTVITSANNATFTVGSSGLFTVTANGSPAPTLSESGTLPSGVTFNAATGVLSGTPAVSTGGTYSITFTANNGVGPAATQTFTLTVNQAPAITSASNVAFTVGTAGSFTVVTTGFPSRTLSESGTLPSGVTFNAATGVLSGTPAAGTGGVYNLTFTANNGVGSPATQSFALNVKQAPGITSAANATFTVGSAGSFKVTDNGHPTPTLSEAGTLPSGVTFNATTGVLSGTPAAGTGGTYHLTFTASNGVGSAATQSFTLTVNQPPAITSVNSAAFTAGTAGSFSVTATGFPKPTLSVTGTLPVGVTFNAATGMLSGTPASGAAGTYNLTVSASTGVGAAATQAFTLTVNPLVVNQPPAITSVSGATFTVASAGTFTVTATGSPVPTLSESGTLPAGVTFNPTTGMLSGTPTTGAGGIYNLTFTANNGVGSASTQSFTLTVNEAPSITSANNATFTIGTAASFTLTTGGFPTTTLAESGTLPAGVTFNPATGQLSGSPAVGTVGTYSLTFTATNGISPPATQSFTLTVNQAPKITSANTSTFVVGTGGSFAVTATGSPAPTLAESGVLPAGLSFNSATGMLSGTPSAGTAGSYWLTFTATSGLGTATKVFLLHINAAPTFTSASSTTFIAGGANSFTVAVNGLPSPIVSESGTLPTGVTFNSTTGVLSGTPATGSTGTYTLIFTASNGIGPAVTQTFTLTVTNGNLPAITSANNAAFTVGTAGSFTVVTSGSQPVTLSESGALPAGVTFNAASGVLSGTPTPLAGGVYNLTFTATNGAGQAATQNFTLTVNEAPKITSLNNTTFTVGTAGSYTLTTSGFPGAKLSESGTLPAGVKFNAATGVLSGTPTAGTGGVYYLTFTATNGIGAVATKVFALRVNAPPVITSPNTATFKAGVAGSFTIGMTGYPPATLTETGNLPAGLTFNPATGAISGTPQSGTQGTYILTFTANNGIGSPVTQTFTLIVD